MSFSWQEGNRIRLLENGEAFFPRVFEAIGEARKEILIETFILFEDKVGLALREALIDAAGRGVKIELTLDGFGCADLSVEFLQGLTEAGVKVHFFDPRSKVMGVRTNVFRRLHRKLVVIDVERAFIGGINYSADHLGDFGPQAKQDYAIEVEGPVVSDMHRAALLMLGYGQQSKKRWWRRVRATAPVWAQNNVPKGDAKALLVVRDNGNHRNDIEEHYLKAIRSARSRLIIANAYFFPGYRLLRELRNAARRGVQVTLIMQGEPDMPIAKMAARMLYNYLLRDGVRVYEYCQRPLHGKVALVDREWATVGSSNLDPLSLSLNLEANLIVRDATFNRELYDCLQRLAKDHCKQISLEKMVKGYFWRAPLVFLIFHFLRHFPSFTALLPAHSPTLKPFQLPETSCDAPACQPSREVTSHPATGDRISEPEKTS
ncbi:cardiolipin synthase ClsB [Pseudomonas mangiferae]|uniref:Cardiolipin synthase B n=1 Tax=Pseudomonas mangiferae TaxID=2593654 RepID=A0A553GVM4_9PSED|nr:cardiolipin synthase ClsB [Pseudomonas mangiferae]TRX73533.1 cardiolipin synthase ClsB [Pseudomonas mangiferae]